MSHRHLIAIFLSLLVLTGCAIVPPEPVETQPAVTTEAPETTAAPTTEAPTEAAPPPETTELTEPAETTEPPLEEVPPYYLAVNCQTNTITAYMKDNNGAYTVPFRVMVCSSGLDGSPSPKGVYRLTGNRWEWLPLVGGVAGMYSTQIVGNFLFHSVPYLDQNDHGSLQEGQFDLLGQDASHGCIRLQVADAKWIYDNMENIDAVELYDDPDPGPLGKPEAPKIGSSPFPGWDPSDPHPDNPWHNPGTLTTP